MTSQTETSSPALLLLTGHQLILTGHQLALTGHPLARDASKPFPLTALSATLDLSKDQVPATLHVDKDVVPVAPTLYDSQYNRIYCISEDAGIIEYDEKLNRQGVVRAGGERFSCMGLAYSENQPDYLRGCLYAASRDKPWIYLFPPPSDGHNNRCENTGAPKYAKFESERINFQDIKLSSDGKYVYALRNQDSGTGALVVLAMPEPGPTATPTLTSEKASNGILAYDTIGSPDRLSLSPDNNYLAVTSRPGGGTTPGATLVELRTASHTLAPNPDDFILTPAVFVKQGDVTYVYIASLLGYVFAFDVTQYDKPRGTFPLDHDYFFAWPNGIVASTDGDSAYVVILDSLEFIVIMVNPVSGKTTRWVLQPDPPLPTDLYSAFVSLFWK